MSLNPRSAADAAQLAAGVVAARHRGDAAGAQALAAEFESEAEAAQAFMLLADISLGLIRTRTGQSMDELVQELSLLVEAVMGADLD